MDDILARIWENLGGRIGGPMKFRLVLQPLMVSVFAIRAGINDARAGHPPFFWTVLSDPQSRSRLLRDGWKDIAKIFAMAIGIDVIYQLIVERWVYPTESLIVAILLAIIPYLILRGPVTRIVRAFSRTPSEAAAGNATDVSAAPRTARPRKSAGYIGSDPRR
jgi:hypothetical protein